MSDKWPTAADSAAFNQRLIAAANVIEGLQKAGAVVEELSVHLSRPTSIALAYTSACDRLGGSEQVGTRHGSNGQFARFELSRADCEISWYKRTL